MSTKPVNSNQSSVISGSPPVWYHTEPSRRRHVSRFTFHSSRSPHSALAFTLIELLVVIAVISLLAAMIIPITGAVKRNEIRAKARAELVQVETAIESYKTKLGHYPPDNPGLPSTNQLYYELLGTTNANGVFYTMDGSGTLAQSAFNVYGPGVTGFINTSQGSSDEARTASTFLLGLKPGQIAQPFPNSAAKFLVCSIPWDRPGQDWILRGVPNVNPICYNSSNPTNNPKSYDLWVDVLIAGKTNRICNWSRDPLTVYIPPPNWPTQE